MTAKEYLLEIRKKKHAMNSLMLRCEELRNKAQGVGAIVYDKERVQVSPEDMMSKVVVQLVDLEERYTKAIAEYYEAIRVLSEQIEQMENPVFAEILRMRYIEEDHNRGLSFEQIAVRTGYTYNTVKNLHHKALREFEKKYLNFAK